MHPFLAYARSKQSSIIALIREFVECESPSDDQKSVDRFVDLLASKVEDVAKVRTFPGGRAGRHMRCEFNLPGSRKRRDDAILTLAHSDTAWPLGTLTQMPYRREDGRLWGPGGLCMRSRIAVFLLRIRALPGLGVPLAPRLLPQTNFPH